MTVKQAVKNLTLLSIMSISISACSSQGVVEEPAPQSSLVIEKPVVKKPAVENTFIKEETVNSVSTNGIVIIPIVEDAKVFAEFTGSLPAVTNYFTNASEAQVIDFYQNAFGEASSQERKRGRLTLQYTEGEEAKRVVISQQNKKRQVDVIVESKN